jgi:hypothetical protein
MLRSRLSYANVVASLALFLALGGGAYAATKLPKNSVTSMTIKDRAVKGRDLAPGAVGSAQIADKSITKADLAASVRDGLDGTPGPRGPVGANGTNGANGANGRDGAGIVASKAYGYTAVNPGKTVVLESMTWTQPAGSLDMVQGWATVGYNGAACNPGEGPTYMLVLDGKEISADDNNYLPDGEGVVLPSAPNLVVGASNTAPVGGEAAAEPADHDQQHTLEVRIGQNCAKSQGPGKGYGGTAAIESLRLYVLRYSR